MIYGRVIMRRQSAAYAFALAAAICAIPALAENGAVGGAHPIDTDVSTLQPQPYNLHGQSTVIEQGNFAFKAPYAGPNSAEGGGQLRESWSVTPSLGVRLFRDTEIYVNPELFQGFGLANTHGFAGFPNGEAQKGGGYFPEVYLARLFIRQTIGLGGEKEAIADDFNQLAHASDINRLTFTFGKMSVSDVFDENRYAHDTREDFLNWSVWESGAFDYAADVKGYTWGATAELNQKTWALRAGYYLVPTIPNGASLDENFVTRGQYILEGETRYTLNGQPGKTRALGWINRGYNGNYAQALALSASSGATVNDAIASTRQTRTKYGIAVNAEQALSDSFGVFARLSWADGQTETEAFTDIDRSAAIGVAVLGTGWGRPHDKVGVAGVINGLSANHQAFLNAGGLGALIGDGRLTYSEEKILETFYYWEIKHGLELTFDYQFFVNPAYNADRGPASVLATRLHVDF